ncbi:B3/B4 domain-containing protein [Alkalihalobacterium elongatum]|uniref:B3/B4 domain-containing protein n=1 Tax=Alkalihalobacterium elongatum TaxID=2675466 RepID=UPI001C1F54FC|nr:phenylalanine--tRNA ligase beta subunit-related protein [Alkalihalobacterium elongatum]
MVQLTINEEVKSLIPQFSIGAITYHSIVVSDTPQMLKGRIRFFQEELAIQLENKELSDFQGISEWRRTFKTLGIDPGRYRPSFEALLRRIKKNDFLPSVNSAVDLNNFLSLRHQIPFGIYDLSAIGNPVFIRIGTQEDRYLGINGRENNMEGKLLSADEKGAFGSPIVDSKRSIVSEATTAALHLVYLQPSMDQDECEQLLQSVGNMFTQVHGGSFQCSIVT